MSLGYRYSRALSGCLNNLGAVADDHVKLTSEPKDLVIGVHSIIGSIQVPTMVFDW